MCVRARARVCECARARMYVCVCVCVRARACLYVFVSTCAHSRVYLCALVYKVVRACVRACVLTNMHAWAHCLHVPQCAGRRAGSTKCTGPSLYLRYLSTVLSIYCLQLARVRRLYVASRPRTRPARQLSPQLRHASRIFLVWRERLPPLVRAARGSRPSQLIPVIASMVQLSRCPVRVR